MKLKIAFLQLMPGNNVEQNLEIGIRACKEAKRAGADPGGNRLNRLG